MRVLLVHAHPDPDSFNAALRDRAIAGLERAGHDVTVLDLYGLGYDPCLDADEHRSYETMADDHPDPVVAQHIDLVRRTEALVFVYPTWWQGLPAILKGWIDRTMLPGVAFTLRTDEPKRVRPSGQPSVKVRPALTHIKSLTGITTYGSGRLEVRLLGDGGRRTLTRSIRLLCHPRCRVTWLGMHRLDSADDQQRQLFLDRVEATMADL